VKRTIVFYRTFFGCPFENFLDSLPGRIVQKITWMLAAIEDVESAAELFFKKTCPQEDIMECRLACEETVFRILSFYQGRDMIVLWGGISMKFQNICARQLERAVRYKNDFLLREADT
jgi:hypothetical protein